MGEPRRTFDKRLVLGGASWLEVLTGAPAWGLAGQPTITRQPIVGLAHDQASIHAHGYGLTVASVWDNETVDTIRAHTGDDDILAAIVGASAAVLLPVRIPSADRTFTALDAATAALSLPSSGHLLRTTTAADIVPYDLKNGATEQALGTPLDKARDSYLIVTAAMALTHASFVNTTAGAKQYDLAITGPGIVPIKWPAAWAEAIPGAKIKQKAADERLSGWVLTLDRQAAPDG